MKQPGPKFMTETKKFILAGALFGFLFPAIATIVRMQTAGMSFRLANITRLHASDPLLLIIDSAPLFLGFFAYLAGKRQESLANLNIQLQQREAELLEERVQLEQRVEERTAHLTRQTDQLRIASFIAQRAAEMKDLGSILNTVVLLMSEQFGFYHAAIFLLNDAGDEVILRAASSDGGKQMIEEGYSQQVGAQEIVGLVAADKKSRVVLDIGADPVSFRNTHLPKSQSESAIPLIIRDKLVGVLDIHSDKPQAFAQEEIDVLETLAGQVAIYIENARLLEESQAALTQLEAVTAVRTRETWGEKLQGREQVYTYTPFGLRAEKGSHTEEKEAVVPINLRGQKIGAISISRKGDLNWGKLDKDLITEVAAQAGLAVDNIRLLEDATQRAQQEQTVGELAVRFSQSLDIDSLLQTAARELGQIPDVSEVSVFVGQIPAQDAPKRYPKRLTGKP